MTHWTPDLTGLAGPRYRAIADALGRDIASASLKPGTRLPTHRDLAFKLGVTVGTVTRAYAEAERRGLIAGEVGRGTYVCEPEGGGTTVIGYFKGAAAAGSMINMGISVPTVLEAPQQVRAVLREIAAKGDIAWMLGYHSDPLSTEQRQAAVRWLADRHRLAAQPEHVRAINGAQHGMITAFIAAARPGDLIVSEILTYTGLKHVAVSLGLRLEGLDYDADGLIPAAFEACCRQRAPRVLYTVPTLHNPTTAIMPSERRREIAAIARRYGVIIVEDDVFGFLPSQAPEPLYNLLPEQVIYLTSFSKCVGTGFRCGYMVVPPGMANRIDAAMLTSQSMPPMLLVEIATRLVLSGEADRLALGQREETRQRQLIAADILAGLDISTNLESHHLWLRLPLPWRREAFAAEARRRGVGVTPADVFTVGHAPSEQAVRLSLCQPEDRAQVERALSILADLLAENAQFASPGLLAVV